MRLIQCLVFAIWLTLTAVLIIQIGRVIRKPISFHCEHGIDSTVCTEVK